MSTTLNSRRVLTTKHICKYSYTPALLFSPIVAYALAVASASSPCSGCVSARIIPDWHWVLLNSVRASSEGAQRRRVTRRCNKKASCTRPIHKCILYHNHLASLSPSGPRPSPGRLWSPAACGPLQLTTCCDRRMTASTWIQFLCPRCFSENHISNVKNSKVTLQGGIHQWALQLLLSNC